MRCNGVSTLRYGGMDAAQGPSADLAPNPRAPPCSYTHRIGRTGRAGRKGTAVTFLTGGDSEVGACWKWRRWRLLWRMWWARLCMRECGNVGGGPRRLWLCSRAHFLCPPSPPPHTHTTTTTTTTDTHTHTHRTRMPPPAQVFYDLKKFLEESKAQARGLSGGASWGGGTCLSVRVCV